MDQFASAELLVLLQEVQCLVEQSAELVVPDFPALLNPFSVKE